MAARFRAPKGTRDLLPPETALWAAVEAIARETFERYGFREIRTPLLEETELFARGVGEGTDIVGKEMYSFVDKGGRNVTLRPENTASVCRAYVEHGMQQLPQPVKLFYIGPQFRYERPQKGRYRQFHQIGAELLGGFGQWADAEVLLLLVAFLRELQFTGLRVMLNTVGDESSRAAFRSALVAYLEPRKDHLGEASRRRLETNPLRILDSKDPEEQEVLSGAPHLRDHLSRASRNHFAGVCRLLESSGIEFELSPRLVRGLDYYTNTVFEIVSEGLGSQNAICGGGAYERLIEELGGKPTYAVGFAIGEDRLIEVLPESFRRGIATRCRVIVAPIGTASSHGAKSLYAEGVLDGALLVCDYFRRNGISAEWAAGKPERVFKIAEGTGARFAVFVGEEELAAGRVSLRDLETREQEQMTREEALNFLQRFLP